MTLLYLTILLIVSYVIGLMVTSYTALPAVICLTFSIPLTKDLESAEVLAKNHAITKRYWVSVVLLTAIFISITLLVCRFGSSVIQIGYALGLAFVFFKILFNRKLIGINRENVADYVETSSNSKYFIKYAASTGTPTNEVLAAIYRKVCIKHMGMITFNMVRKESLDMTHERWSRNEIRKRAEELFIDAVRAEPETSEGQLARTEAQKYAAYITQLVRMETLDDVTNETRDLIVNHPIFGFSEEKKKRLANELD